jgi:hypothetical protein
MARQEARVEIMNPGEPGEIEDEVLPEGQLLRLTIGRGRGRGFWRF